MDHSEFYHLDAILDEFDRQWHAGRRPQIEQLLSEKTEVNSSNLLQELLLIEIECRRRMGERPTQAEYEGRFPQGRGVVTRVFELLEVSNSTSRDTDAYATKVLPHTSSGSFGTFLGAKVGPYELVEPLGKGAFGEVWLGKRHGALATTSVAIKIPWNSKTTRRVLRDEAQSWVRASGHPNVVPIIEADVYGEVVAIVSEYVDGGTLASRIQQTGGLAPSLAVEIAIGILAGLEFLHARGIIHRDLKPANILLQHGIPRLTDFGLARSGDTAEGIAGTPAYMAPEALDGGCSVRTDLWSAGVVLFEMLTGGVPFKSDTLAGLMDDIRGEGKIVVPPKTPTSLRDVFTKALDKDPARRYKSAADMRAALSACRRSLANRSDQPASDEAPHHLTISVTGSMRADPESVRQRLSLLLAPYETPLTTWYTGSNGVVDEQAAEMLVSAGQQVFLVGYTESDISPTSARLIEDHDLPFVDAEGEDVPPEPNAPSKRDIFFATKSDLVILVWDGCSSGTRQLQIWLQQHNRDHLMIYV